MKSRKFVIAFVLLALAALPLAAQDSVDEEATKMIREYTTDPKFTTPLVDYLPASDSVPSPLKVLGYVSGTPGKQTYYDDILRYYRALAEASDRVTIIDLGKSHQGNMMVVVAVSDAENIRDLDRYRAYTKELADSRSCDEERKREIITKAKPFYLFSGGLHSPETGSPEMLMEMAYRLAVSETEMIRRIRANVITLIVPVLEMDGWNRQVDWYYRHTKKVEKWEDLTSRSTPYWGAYTHHDNNRDGIMVSQPLTENLYKAFFMFHPQVTHDLHESVPLLYISTGTGPYNTTLDPVVIDEWQWFAFNEVTQMTKYGVPGVWTWGFYTGWYPGYLLWIGNNHNSIGRFYETYGNAGANTYERKVSFGREPGRGITSRQWYRPSPPPEKVEWSLRNNTNLMQSGCLLALDFTARNMDTILENFWIKGRNAVDTGSSKKPFAWIVQPEQSDHVAANRMVSALRKHHIEMHRLTKDLELGEKTYPAGSIVVRLDQPYRNLTKTLLEIQTWPADSKTNPYDATAWTLGLMLGVETERIDDKAILEAEMEPLGDEMVFTGGVEDDGGAEYVLIPPQGVGMINLFLKLSAEGISVKASDKELEIDGESYPSGTWVLPGSAREKIDAICRELGLKGNAVAGGDFGETREISLPRLAMYHTWFNTQESGWVRYTLDEAGVPYTLIGKDRVRRGDLLGEFDVILVPHQGGRGNGLRILRGLDGRRGPLAFDRTDEFEYMGFPDSSPDITGGLGLEGALEFERFVMGGGTLIAFGSGCSFVTDFGMVRGIQTQRSSGLTCPGTIVAGTVRQPGNPIAYGYGEHPSIYRGSLPLMSVEKKMRKYIVLQFGTKLPDDDGPSTPSRTASQTGEEGEKPKEGQKKVPLLRSGLLRNGSSLDGTAAIVDVPAGEGRVVLFAFNPMYRWMNQANFSFAYNAILNWNAPAALREAPEKEEKEEEKAEK